MRFMGCGEDSTFELFCTPGNPGTPQKTCFVRYHLSVVDRLPAPLCEITAGLTVNLFNTSLLLRPKAKHAGSLGRGPWRGGGVKL